MTTNFAQLSTRAQVNRLRTLALKALEPYTLEPARLRLLSHGFNTIFRVETRTQKFALRMNVNSKRSQANIHAELSWLEALGRDTDLMVPRPIPLPDGALMQVLELPTWGAVPCVLFAWLPGVDLEDRLSPTRVEQMGRISATLHRHASGFKLPKGARLTVANDVLFGLKNVLFMEPDPRVNPKKAALFGRAHGVAQARLEHLFARLGPPRILHADLHEGNFKDHRGEVSVFDFDDSVIGHPVQDVATTLYHLATEDEYPAYRAAYQRGYTSVSPWNFDDADLETLMAGRALLLLNDVLLSANPDMREIAPSFLERVHGRLERFLKTGIWKA